MGLHEGSTIPSLKGSEGVTQRTASASACTHGAPHGASTHGVHAHTQWYMRTPLELTLVSGDSLDSLDCILPLAPPGLDAAPAPPHLADRAALASGPLPPPLGMGLGLAMGLGLLPPLLSRLLALASSPLGPRLRNERLRLRSWGVVVSTGFTSTSTPIVRGSGG